MSSEATVTNDILTTPALELGRRIAAREQSSTEVTGAFLDQIDAVGSRGPRLPGRRS